MIAIHIQGMLLIWDTDDLVLEEISSKDIIKSDLNIVKLPSICDDGYYLYIVQIM